MSALAAVLAGIRLMYGIARWIRLFRRRRNPQRS